MYAHDTYVQLSLEWLEGSPNLDGSTFSLLWIYLVFMNGLWVVIPLLLLWDSFARLTQVSKLLDLIKINYVPQLTKYNYGILLGC
jgi:hypothetical protein